MTAGGAGASGAGVPRFMCAPDGDGESCIWAQRDSRAGGGFYPLLRRSDLSVEARPAWTEIVQRLTWVNPPPPGVHP